MQNTSLANRSWTWPFALIGAAFLLIFGVFIFTQLDQRPMHNDESVNAWFFENLLVRNEYKYNPDNYHGPSLYYLQLPVTWLSPNGITPTSIRTGVATAGLVLLCGLLFSKRRIGRWGALTALVLLGSSCGFIFYARYFIHEIYFVSFTYGIYLSAVYWRDTKRPFYFYLLCLSAALLYATKETSVLVFGVLALSAILSDVRHVKKHSFAMASRLKFHLLGGLALALLIWLLLYSSFFTHMSGLLDSVRAYTTWTKTGLNSGHEKRFLYFMADLLLPYESPLVFVSLIGAAAAIITGEKSGLFLLFWAVGILLVHSIIPYKTPWLVLNFLVPMALLGGFGVQTIVKRIQEQRDMPAAISMLVFVLMGTSIFLIRQFPKTVWITYVEYDNDIYPYVYAHTSRDIYRLRNDIDRIAQKTGMGKDLAVDIVSKIEWPLPFYLRAYKEARFLHSYEDMSDLQQTPVIIADKEQHDGLAKKVDIKKYTVSPYLLRRGIPLELWVKKDFYSE